MEEKNKLLPEDIVVWLREVCEGEVLSAAKMVGATSSTLHRVVISAGGETKDYVLRRFTNKDWLKHEPDLAEREASALRVAEMIGINAPRLIAYDDGEECDEPVVLMSFVPGEVVLKPKDMDGWLRGLAEMLSPVHSVTGRREHLWDYYPWYDYDELEAPEWSRDPDLWWQAIKMVSGKWPAYKPVFIHRDFHPTNVLWNGNGPGAVVDWVNACIGPAGVDLGHCRMNLVWLYGVDAADRFLAHYCALTGYWHNPFWDLLLMMEWLPEKPSMYRPWLEFGFDNISEEALMARMDAHLVRVMRKVFE